MRFLLKVKLKILYKALSTLENTYNKFNHRVGTNYIRLINSGLREYSRLVVLLYTVEEIEKINKIHMNWLDSQIKD